MGIFSFLAERDWSRNSCHGNSTKGVILFLFWYTFMVPSFKNTASIFLEISFIKDFPLFSCKQWSNLHNRKMAISLKRKKVFQKEKRHSSVLWKAFQKSTNYFSFHSHFNNTHLYCFRVLSLFQLFLLVTFLPIMKLVTRGVWCIWQFCGLIFHRILQHDMSIAWARG